MNDPHHERELIKEIDGEYKDYRDWMYKQDWSELAKHPGIREYLDKLRMLTELIKE